MSFGVDTNGKKPKMSRGLVNRLSGAIDSGREQLGATSDSARGLSMGARRNVYRSSHLGQTYGVRQMGAEMGKPIRADRKGSHPQLKSIDTGQNRPSAGFQEPKGRGYNPYP